MHAKYNGHLKDTWNVKVKLLKTDYYREVIFKLVC
jgi:hypothetical protein